MTAIKEVTTKRKISTEVKERIGAGVKAPCAARKAKEATAPALPATENADEVRPSEVAMASGASIEASSIAKDANPEPPAESNPVTQFKLWLEQASANDLEEAEPELEQKVLSCYRSGHNWRLAIGECFYKHREVVKKRGTRDWTKWVTETTGTPRSTAYDLIRGWLEEHGHGVEEHNEPDRRNPKADEINDAIAKARDKRTGRHRAPAGPELDLHVPIPWPKTFVTREECGRFKEECERDPDRVYRLCRAAIVAVIAQPQPGPTLQGSVEPGTNAVEAESAEGGVNVSANDKL